jgi:DNA-binding PadR family transcriptional regulator
MEVQMHRGFCEKRERRSRHGWGGHGMRGAFRGGRGGIGRLLEHGDLRFVIMALLEQQPSHGYELIKALEQRTGGAYRPSPGVVYPTLSLLEDEGFIRPSGDETARKLYALTDEGRAALEANRQIVTAVFARMSAAAERAGASGPRVGRAMANLGMALEQRLGSGTVSPETLDAIVSLIDQTAAAVEKA